MGNKMYWLLIISMFCFSIIGCTTVAYAPATLYDPDHAVMKLEEALKSESPTRFRIREFSVDKQGVSIKCVSSLNNQYYDVSFSYANVSSIERYQDPLGLTPTELTINLVYGTPLKIELRCAEVFKDVVLSLKCYNLAQRDKK